jgi:AmmeMemoRadiSam system protein A
MNKKNLTDEEKQMLLQLARETLECYARGESTGKVNLSGFPPALCEDGATFVTLTTADGSLRGCIGALEACRPLVEDVWEHTMGAALDDYRFNPVQPEEVPSIKIEISYLTPPQPIDYSNPEELVQRVRPGVDGVIFQDGPRRATFLPQVWKKVPRPEDFFSHLCAKMGEPGSLWRRKHLEVFVYQVDEFHE